MMVVRDLKTVARSITKTTAFACRRPVLGTSRDPDSVFSRGIGVFGIILPLLAIISVGDASAEPAGGKSGLSRSEVESITQDYLLSNPQVIIDALEIYRKRLQDNATEATSTVLKERADEIFADPEAPIVGNLAGDVSLVEFFDYQCGYCKRVYPTLKKALAEDGNVRFVFKEFPILGKVSEFAARVALASRWQGKYIKLHDALMAARGTLSQGRVLRIASEAGVDVDRLKVDLETRRGEIDEILRRNIDLATALGINGTPGFVIEDAVIQGALTLESLKDLIAAARNDRNQ